MTERDELIREIEALLKTADGRKLKIVLAFVRSLTRP